MKFVVNILILYLFLLKLLLFKKSIKKFSNHFKNKFLFDKFQKFSNETKLVNYNHDSNKTSKNLTIISHALTINKESPEFENFDVSEFIITAIKIWKKRPFFVWNFFVEERLGILVQKFKEIYLNNQEIKSAETIIKKKIDLKNKTLLKSEDGLYELDPRQQCIKILDSVHKNQNKFNFSLPQESQEYQKALRVVNLLNKQGLVYFKNRIFDFSGKINRFKLGLESDGRKIKEIEDAKKEYKAKCRNFFIKVIPEDYKLTFVRKFIALIKVLIPYFSEKVKSSLNTEEKLKLFFDNLPLIFRGFSLKDPNRVKEIIDININMKDLIDKIRYRNFNQLIYKTNISRNWGCVIGLSVLSLSEYLEFFKPSVIKLKPK